MNSIPIHIVCIFFSAIAFGTLLSGCDRIELHSVPPEPFVCEDQSWPEARTNPYRFIAHAGGEIDGHRYTNSRQALDLAYANGLRLFEIDLISTVDDKLVGAHDWEGWRESSAASGRIEPTHADFKSVRLFGKYEPLDVADLDRWFTERGSAFLITDKVTDFESLVEGFSHLDRLIVEVFSVEDYGRAQEAGIRYPMLSLRSAIANDGEKEVLGFLAKNPVKFVAVSRKIIWEYKDLLRSLRANKTCVYMFTSSDPQFLEEVFDDVTFGTYTDSWNLNNGTCETANCDSY